MNALEKTLVKTASETGLSLEEVIYLMEQGLEKVAASGGGGGGGLRGGPAQWGILDSLIKTWNAPSRGGKINVGIGMGASGLLGYLLGMRANRDRNRH